MSRYFLTCWPVIVLLFAVSFAARAHDDIPPAQLPAPVGAALKKQFPAAVIVSAQKSEERNDYVYYYVTISSGKSRLLATVTEIGEITATEPAK